MGFYLNDWPFASPCDVLGSGTNRQTHKHTDERKLRLLSSVELSRVRNKILSNYSIHITWQWSTKLGQRSFMSRSTIWSSLASSSARNAACVVAEGSVLLVINSRLHWFWRLLWQLYHSSCQIGDDGVQHRQICSIVNTLVTFALPSRNPLMAM